MAALALAAAMACRPPCPEVIPVDAPVDAPPPVTVAAPARAGDLVDASSENLVVSLPWPRLPGYRNVSYEGNNPALRTAGDDGAIPSGEEVARRWREAVARTRRVFVLRDSLFSQQDHPYRHRPWAPILPPGWISVAADAALRGASLRPLSAPDASADGRWRRMRAAEVFGDFPPSTALLRRATASLCGADPEALRSVVNARRTLASLARDVEKMRAALPEGPDAVALAGAERIAASDVRYFGAELRRERVVPILVENPLAEEVAMGKGLRPASQPLLSDEAFRLTRRAVLRRRLRDGDVAVERYDLADPEQHARALEVVRDVLSSAPPQAGRLWIWLSGPAAEDGRASPRAAAALASFRDDLGRAGVDPERVGLFYMPRAADRAAVLTAELAALDRAAAPIPLLIRAGAGEGLIRARDTGGEAANR